MDVKTIALLFSVAIFVDANRLKHHYVLKSEADVTDDSVDDDWWRTAIFYQIYPRSFKDSNGDGIGDLQGIISKLDHLTITGVTAAWLSPIYKSPGVDQGYDISDYRDIDPIFGNITDLRVLVDKAHEKGIKIIMDFVPNHTSDKHDWFIQSAKGNKTYADYYIWAGNATTKSTLPNNWISAFGGPAWTWNDDRKQYYLHQFSSAQPDLNYNNAAVVTAMKDVLKYWLDFGIDGFRMDAVPCLFEDPELRNEPLSGAAGLNASDYGYLKHIYTTNLDKTYDMIYQFRQVLDDYNKGKNISYSRVMMTEAYTETSEQLVLYYGNETSNGAHFTFNFNFITDLSINLTADSIIRTTDKWLSHLDKKYVSNWVLGNHDQHRVATRLGVNNIDALNMLAAFLPGIQVTYMGEEIGMEDGNVTCKQDQDPQAKDCSVFLEKSRDFERTPYQWDGTANAGFSSNSSTWLPVSDKYKKTNLDSEYMNGMDMRSHYNVYRSMVKFRENFKNVSYDALSLIKLSDNVLQIVRKTDKAEFAYLFNTGDNAEQVDIFTNDVDFKVSVCSVNSKHSVGDVLSNVTLQPHESLILEPKGEVSGANLILSTGMFSLVFIVCLMQFF